MATIPYSSRTRELDLSVRGDVAKSAFSILDNDELKVDPAAMLDVQITQSCGVALKVGDRVAVAVAEQDIPTIDPNDSAEVVFRRYIGPAYQELGIWPIVDGKLVTPRKLLKGPDSVESLREMAKVLPEGPSKAVDMWVNPLPDKQLP
jgi:hypothetical protein